MGPAPPAARTSVLRYTLNRIALGLVSLLLLSMMVFAAAQVLPGNPGRLVLGREATPEAVEEFNEKLGYNRPLPVRYVDWLSGAVRGDFGANYTDGRAVTDDLVPALKRSALLALYAFVLCVPLSILGRRDRRRAPRQAARPDDHRRGALARRDPGLRARRDPRRGLRACIAQLVPRHRRLSGRPVAPDEARLALPPRARARARALRLHRPDHASRDDRGARRRLHAHGNLKGLPRRVSCAPTWSGTGCCRPSPSSRPRSGTCSAGSSPSRSSSATRDRRCSSSAPRRSRTSRCSSLPCSSSASSTSWRRCSATCSRGAQPPDPAGGRGA